MKNFLIVILMLVLIDSQLNAQVLTRYLTSDQNMEEIITFQIDENIPYYLQPDIDFNKVAEQDKMDVSTMARFAVNVDQNYNVKDGLWYQLGGLMIWQIGFSAPHASSLNFLISDLNLPK